MDDGGDERGEYDGQNLEGLREFEPQERHEDQ